jgi:hypothetical protein
MAKAMPEDSECYRCLNANALDRLGSSTQSRRGRPAAAPTSEHIILNLVCTIVVTVELTGTELAHQARAAAARGIL